MKREFAFLDMMCAFLDEEIMYLAVEEPDTFIGKDVTVLARSINTIGLYKRLLDKMRSDGFVLPEKVDDMAAASYYLWRATTNIQQAMYFARQEAFRSKKITENLT